MSFVKLIIVEDSEDDLLLVLRALKKGGFDPAYTRVDTEEGLRKALEDDSWQMVISDHAMPRFSAPEALEVVKKSGRDLPFIIVSGTIGEEIAVSSMRGGAHDYIMKDNLARLAPAVARELREVQVRESQKRYETQLKFLTIHDQLTGLYNRVYFENELERLDGSCSYPVTVISADLDGLKLINDTFGQKEGDRILQVCAELLKKPLRKGDILARVGGDEFQAILPIADQLVAEEIINIINADVEQYNQNNANLPISISIGYATSADPTLSLDDAVKDANSAMWLDKQNRSESARSKVVKALLAALSERDYIAGGHAERLDDLCAKIGTEIGLDKHSISNLSLLAQVHDLGKVGIPDRILFKVGSLDEEEWQVMKQHPEIGCRIAQTTPELEPVADLILKHHEKWDGSGYPLGLAKEEIPVECRILAIVDAYDAMTNDRPYRKAKADSEALQEIERFSGRQFDPELVKVFLSVI
jgi:diguanylate cyclase (GGDEF)-like protein